MNHSFGREQSVEALLLRRRNTVVSSTRLKKIGGGVERGGDGGNPPLSPTLVSCHNKERPPNNRVVCSWKWNNPPSPTAPRRGKVRL